MQCPESSTDAAQISRIIVASVFNSGSMKNKDVTRRINMNVKHLPPEEMKKKVLRFRVTDEEHERLMKQAKSKGYSTFSDYVRDLISKDNSPSKGHEPPFNSIGEEMI